MLSAGRTVVAMNQCRNKATVVTPGMLYDIVEASGNLCWQQLCVFVCVCVCLCM